MIKLTKENIADIAENPDKYKGCHFVIDGNDLHDGRKSFNVAVLHLIMVWRHLPFTISIASPNKAKKLSQDYYTSLILTFDKERK